MSDDYPYPLTPYMAKLRANTKVRNDKIFKLYLTSEYTLKEIGVKFGLSGTRIHEIVQVIVRRNRRQSKL